MIASGAVFVPLYTLSGVSPPDAPDNTTLPGPCPGTGVGPDHLGEPGRGPTGHDRLDGVPVHPAGDPAHRGLARGTDRAGERVRDRAQRSQQRRISVGGPLRRPGEPREPGRGERHHQHGQHEGGRVPAGPAGPRIGHRAQRPQQITGVPRSRALNR